MDVGATTRTKPAALIDDRTERRRLVVRGVVQGVGFRPFVVRLAEQCRVRGFCGNDDASVFIEIEGARSSLRRFESRLSAEAPALSVVIDVSSESIAAQGEEGFRILPSRSVPGARTLLPPDVATCADCLREFADPGDRRYRHPFVNCTNCGPRYTVVTDLPYDRPNTTMARFEMCARCRAEYTDPEDRRYHAQPISCPECGPRIFAIDSTGRRVDTDAAVISAVQQAVRAGGVVAVKGIGGFHLICDATNQAAVTRLRDRKRRPDKPFAVMAADSTAAERICVIDSAATKSLTAPARPIVLLPKRSDTAIADAVAPGLDRLGLVLPYSGLHELLFAPIPDEPAPDMPRFLVMTSGNLSGEPLCHDNDDAIRRLAGIADLFLMHDRPIAVPCEDSVVAVQDGSEIPIRRSRGYAPLPVALPGSGPTVLGVGAEVKNTFCLTRQDMAFCSPHLGDMSDLESMRAFGRAVEAMTRMHRTRPELVVADRHPGYATHAWAQRYCDAENIPLQVVQHHHAHVAALLAEHGRLGRPAVGVAYDGTGYGCDRTVWGGEMLLVDSDVPPLRVGHLQPFWLPGGDAAVRNPVRVAWSLLHESAVTERDGLPCTAASSDAERRLLDSQLSAGAGCVRTTSVGRLFDAVASLLGIRHRVSYEAQAAIELEAVARGAHRSAPLEMACIDGVLRFDGLIGGIVDQYLAGVAVDELALGFHLALAEATTKVAATAARAAGVETIGLTGGVFQNLLLLGMVRTMLQKQDFEVLTHHVVPANDGGLALGQAALGWLYSRQSGTKGGVR